MQPWIPRQRQLRRTADDSGLKPYGSISVNALPQVVEGINLILAHAEKKLRTVWTRNTAPHRVPRWFTANVTLVWVSHLLQWTHIVGLRLVTRRRTHLLFCEARRTLHYISGSAGMCAPILLELEACNLFASHERSNQYLLSLSLAVHELLHTRCEISSDQPLKTRSLLVSRAARKTVFKIVAGPITLPYISTSRLLLILDSGDPKATIIHRETLSYCTRCVLMAFSGLLCFPVRWNFQIDCEEDVYDEFKQLTANMRLPTLQNLLNCSYYSRTRLATGEKRTSMWLTTLVHGKARNSTRPMPQR